MPVFTVTAPDGRTYDVNAPEGATQEQAFEYVRQNYYGGADPAAKKNRNVVKDLGVSFAGGANALLEGVGSLYGLATGDMDNWARNQGASGREYWQEQKSDALTQDEKNRKAAIDSADGELAKFGTAFWETVKNPALLSSSVTEQIPMFLPIGMAGRAGQAATLATGVAQKGASLATKASTAVGNSNVAARMAQRGLSAFSTAPKFAGAAGTTTAIGTGAALQGADVGGDAYSTLIGLPEALWEQNQEYIALRAKIGQEQAKHAIAHDLAQQAAGEGGAVSVLTNLLPWARTFEQFSAKVPMSGSAVMRGMKGGLGEATQEASEEGLGRVAVNRAVQDVDQTQSLTEGMGEAAGLGAVPGGAMGVFSGLASKRADNEIQPAQIPDAPLTEGGDPASTDTSPTGPLAGQDDGLSSSPQATQQDAASPADDGLAAPEIVSPVEAAAEIVREQAADTSPETAEIDQRLSAIADELPTRTEPVQESLAREAEKLTRQKMGLAERNQRMIDLAAKRGVFASGWESVTPTETTPATPLPESAPVPVTTQETASLPVESAATINQAGEPIAPQPESLATQTSQTQSPQVASKGAAPAAVVTPTQESANEVAQMAAPADEGQGNQPQGSGKNRRTGQPATGTAADTGRPGTGAGQAEAVSPARQERAPLADVREDILALIKAKKTALELDSIHKTRLHDRLEKNIIPKLKEIGEGKRTVAPAWFKRQAKEFAGKDEATAQRLNAIADRLKAQDKAVTADAPAAQPVAKPATKPTRLTPIADAKKAEQDAADKADAEAKKKRIKKEDADRKAVVMAGREAAKKAEVDAAVENYALGQEPPKPIEKAANKDQLAGQGGLFAQPPVQPKPDSQKSTLDIYKDGVDGEEVAFDRVPNGNEAFQYALGRTESDGQIAIFRRPAGQRGSYGGWRWEADSNKLNTSSNTPTPAQKAPDSEKQPATSTETPAGQPAATTAQPAQSKPESAQRAKARPADTQDKQDKIEDFGEKLPPARRAMAARLNEELSDDVIESQPLSKIWPLKENEAIKDTFAAAVATVMRENIPSKPRKGYKVKSWVSKVKTLRELAAQVVGGQVDKDSFMAGLRKASALKDLASRIKLLEQIDRMQWSRIGDVTESPNAMRYEDGKPIPAPVAFVKIDGANHWLKGSGDINDHMDAINALLSGDAKEARMQFEIRQERSSKKVFINKTGDKEYRRLMEFDTVEDARKAMQDQYDDLVAAWDGVKSRDNINERDLRSEENRPRSGKDHRKGKDITAEEFQEAFGFRGGEFGKWVSQGKNAQERQFFLNSAYDAFMDLADIIGVPPKAISLEGTLGIAFGSRGSGWASAHFEPSNLVINLTKPRGAGALAHEWFHALDNYFARKRGGEVVFTGDNVAYRDNNYITHKTTSMMVRKDGKGSPVTRERLASWRKSSPDSAYLAESEWMPDPNHKEGVRAEVEERFENLVNVLNQSPMLNRSQKLERSGDYWSRTLERAARSFENYIQSRMMEQGYHNDFLANVKNADVVGKSKDRYPYLLPEEIAPVAEAFDSLFNTIQTKETGNGVTMFSRAVPWYSPLNRAVQTAKRDTMPGQQWKLWLQGNKAQLGLKDDELQWSGVLDYLDLRGKDKVTKAEIADYLSGNGVKVEDVVKGQSWRATLTGDNVESFASRQEAEERIKAENAWVDDESMIVDADEDAGYIQVNDFDGNQYAYITKNEDGEWVLTEKSYPLNDYDQETFDDFDSASDRAEEIAEEQRDYWRGQISNEPEEKETATSAKFAGYWDSIYKGGIPGTYREILVTLPEKAKNNIESRKKVAEAQRAYDSATTPADRAAALARLQELDRPLRDSDKAQGVFRSSHWDEPNVLVHVRLDEVTGADGKRYVRVGEVQGDFGQAYKKQKDAIKKAVDTDFQGIVGRMQASGVLKVEC